MLRRLQQQYTLIVHGRHSAQRLAPLRALDGRCVPSSTIPRLAAVRAPTNLSVWSRQKTQARAVSVPPQEVAPRPQHAAPYTLINFYHLVDLPQPFRMLRLHREFCEGRDLSGRIYISKQGINAQYSGATEDALAYVEWVSSLPEFSGLHWISDPVDMHHFPKLRLKYRPNLVSLAGGMTTLPVTQPEARATPLQPEEWARMLRDAKAPRGPVVLDVRNSYEWDAGHFEGAQRPLEDNFNETPTEATQDAAVPAYLAGRDPSTPVMMYCTGGIRCDIYSTYLRRKGFTNLYTLEGGVHNYLRQKGGDQWNGSLFVFDNRMAVAPPGKDLQAAVQCTCGAPAVLPHMNCANLDCNALFLTCDACRMRYAGCCCETCMAAPRLLRPAKQEGGHFGKWTEYVDDVSEQNQHMAQGRAPGRLERRRRRALRQRAKEAGMREVRAARRQMAKAAMAERAPEDEQNKPTSNRLEQLQALRQRLVIKSPSTQQEAS